MPRPWAAQLDGAIEGQMPIPFLSIVQMKSWRYRSEGIEPGAIGVVVEIYGDDQYEVEFSDHVGITIALLTIGKAKLS